MRSSPPPAAAPLAFLLAAVPLAAGLAQAPPPPLRGFDSYIESALRAWDVPGLAIAVVKNDSVVWARGFGVRELGRPEPVDARTIFANASTTKAFTAALVGMEVDAGVMTWDDRLTRWLPGLRLYDPYASAELTLRDAMSHRSGLGRADGLWYGSTLSRGEILRRLQFEQPSWSFRSTYGYNNNMFIAVGEALAAATHRSWDDLIRERILVPLGMTSTSTSVSALAGRDDVARPHAWRDGRTVAIPWRNFDNVGPAGSLNSNVTDMAQWVRLHLGDGVYDGRRLLSHAAIREMRRPNMPQRPDERTDSLLPEIHVRAYTMGWAVHDFRGRLVQVHDGALDGMRARVALMPEEHLGVVMFANSDQAGLLLQSLAYRVFDAYTGNLRRDWAADFLAYLQESRRREAADERRQDSTRARGTQPSHALDAYAGTYRDSLYGAVTIALENGALVARLGDWAQGDLEHWHYDVFRITWRDQEFGKDFVRFNTGFDGKVASLTIQDMDDFGRVAPDTPRH